MAVNVGQRNVPDTPQYRGLKANELALNLSIHTIKITSNPKVFDNKYQKVIDKIEDCLVNIKTKLKEIGFEAHPKKTHIRNVRKGFTFLGFEYRLTNTGKIIKTLNSENVHHERKKLRREVNLYRNEKMSLNKIYEGFNSWCENASHGNSYKVINRTKKYLKELIENGN